MMLTLPLMHAPLLGVLLSLLIAGMAGCGGAPTPPASERPASAAWLLDAAEARLATRHSARIVGRVEAYQGGERVRLRQVLLVQRPGSLRLETLSPFDVPLQVVMTNPRAVIHYDVQREAYRSGPPTASSLATLLPVRLSPPDLVRTLLGGVPSEGFRWDHAATPTWDRRRGAWRVEGRGPGGEGVSLWFRHASWALAGVEARDEAGAFAWGVDTALWQQGPGGEADAYPRAYRLRVRGEGLDLSLEIERYDREVELMEELFELEPPFGVTPHPL